MPAMRGLFTLVLGLIVSLAAGAAVAQSEAIAAARIAVERSPNQPAGYETLARLQLKAGDSAGAVATYRKLVEAVPEYARGRYRLAFALRKAGRLDDAAAAYRAYLDSVGDDPDGHFGLGRTLEKLGDAPGAVKAYTRYVELETRPSEAKWVEDARGRIAALGGPSIAAAAATDGAPAAEPTTPPTTISDQPAPATTASAQPAAVAPASAAQPEGSVSAEAGAAPSGSAAAVAPAPASGQRAVEPAIEPAADPEAAFARGAYAAAEAGFAQQLEARPDDPNLRYRRAVSAAMAGAFDRAEAQAGSAVRLDPGNPPASDLARVARAHTERAKPDGRVMRAEVERAVRDGRARTAIRLAELALREATDTADRAMLLRLQGRALLALDQVDAAFDALKGAAALRPPTADLWVELATAAERRGDRSAARQFQRLARLVAEPEHPIMSQPRGVSPPGPEDR